MSVRSQGSPLGGGRSLERAGVRYEIYAEIGSGGMATVEYARLLGAHGFVRSVAIKRLHPQFAKDPEFVKMFIDEAQLSARLVHANIVATLDVIDGPRELALVMEYVHGESLWNLLRLCNQFGKQVPVRVAVAIAASVLHGLHAAHEARNERGELLDLVHRDVSPHNILIGDDGIPRLIDFGVAKAVGRLRVTSSGEIKGKLIYMAPEQLSGGAVDRRADVYGAAAVLWETLTGLSLFDGETESAIVHDVLLGTIEQPGHHRRGISNALDRIVMRGLKREPADRFATAREMAIALEHDVGAATQSELAGWLQELAGGRLSERRRLLQDLLDHPAQRTLTAADRLEPTREQVWHEPATVVVARGSELRPHEPATARRLAIGLSLALLTLMAAAFWYGRERAPQLARSARVQPVTSTAAASDPAPDDVPSGKSPPQSTQIAPAASAPPPARPHAKSERARGREAPPPSAARPKPDCKPHDFVDPQGIRHPKPECL